MNKRSKNSRALLVLASAKPLVRKSFPAYTVASYSCKCGHRGAVQASLEDPHCPACGAEVDATADKTVARYTGNTQLLHLKCCGCDSINNVTASVASELSGRFHCVTCGTGLDFDLPEDDEDMDIDSVLSDTDLTNDTGADDLDDAFQDEAEHEADDYLGGDSADEDDDEEEEADLDDDEDGQDDEDDEDDTPESALSSLSTLETLTPKQLKRIDVIASAGCIYLMAKDSCVATLRPNTKNGRVFGTKAHLSLIAESLANKGAAHTVKDFSFTPTIVEVDSNQAFNTVVAKTTAQLNRKQAAKMKQHANVMNQSLSIAAAGLNRDLFSKEIANPLKVSLLNTLTKLGVDKVTASLQIQNAFRDGGDAYVQALISKAMELSSQSDEVRNALADSLVDTQAPVPDLDEDDEESCMDDDQTSAELDDADTYFDDAGNGISEEDLGVELSSVQSGMSAAMRPSTTASQNAANGTRSRGYFAPSALSHTRL